MKQRNKGREDFAERGLCRYGSKCLRTHPTNEEVRGMLAEWWRRERGGDEATWSVARMANNAALGGGRASASSMEAAAENEGAGAAEEADAEVDARAGRSDGAVAAATGGRDDPGSAAAAAAAAGAGTEGREDEEASEATTARVTGWVVGRLAKKTEESAYIGRLLAEPFFDTLMVGRCRLTSG